MSCYWSLSIPLENRKLEVSDFFKEYRPIEWNGLTVNEFIPSRFGRVHSFSTFAKFSEKLTFLSVRIRGVRNVSVSGNFSNILNQWALVVYSSESFLQAKTIGKVLFRFWFFCWWTKFRSIIFVMGYILIKRIASCMHSL